jgi:uncharacterized protein with HEPN domain
MSRHDPEVRLQHMLDILWTIIQDDLPPLIEQLEVIIEEEA